MRLPLFIFIFILPYVLLSQGSSHGVTSLKLPTTPYTASTCEAFVADPTSIQSILINPANLALQESYNILFAHTEWMQDTRTEFLSVSAPFRYGSIALSISNTSVDGIEVRDIPGPAIGIFNYQSTSFQLTYGAEISEHIRIGFAPKYLYDKIFVDETSGFGCDAGIYYNKLIDNFDIGFSFTEIGSLSAFRKDRVDLPATLRIGGTYFFIWDKINIRTAASYSSELGASYQHTNLGAEVSYNKLLAIRLGYQTGYEVRSISMGIGIRYEIVSIDYAYIPFTQQAGNAHIISIGFNL